MAGPERIMAENPPGIGESTGVVPASHTPVRLPIYRAPEFDSGRKDYQTRIIGQDVIFIDPLTRTEVARMPKIEGGSPEATIDLESLNPPEDIWSAGFREWGIHKARQIMELEGKDCQKKYTDNGQRLNQLYEQWRKWVALKGEQSFTREPFNESDIKPELAEPKPTREPAPGPEGQQLSESERQTREMLRRVYWAPYYADYFHFTAQTPEQFEKAVRTFTQWVRTGLGKSPNEIFKKVNGFKEALTATGNLRVLATEKETGRDQVTSDFVLNLRRELEALAGVFGADWANEHYNTKNLQDFLGFLAQDEGPARFVRLSKLYKGKVAAVLWKLDKDPKFELLFSPHGSRGQLMGERDAVAQQELIEQIKAMLIAEIMGVEIKNYHPDDPQQRKRDKFLEGNLDEIAKFQSDEKFKNLFEGFDQKEQDGFYQKLTLKQYLSLKPAERTLLERLEKVRSIRERLNKGANPSKLPGDDKAMYEEAESAFTLAYQLYGVMGEKARRSGGVFLVDRQVGDKKYIDYVPVHWAEKFVQFAVNWTKAHYADKPADFIRIAVEQARKSAIAELKKNGFDAKLSYAEASDIKYEYHTKDQKGEPFLTPQLRVAPDKKTGNLQIKWGKEHPMTLNRPRILGYSQDGQPVIAVNQEGKLVVLGKGEVPIYDEPSGENRKRVELAKDILTKLIKRDDGAYVCVDKVEVNFQTAVDHIYSRWTSHPYWGYQEEDTSLFLSRRSFEDAKKIKAGTLRPEDASPHAVQLLIVDPTLERVGRFPHKEGREDKITLAAIEDSYQNHWLVTDELYQAFYSQNVKDEHHNVIYNLQDQGGATKQLFHIRAEAARWTDMKMRRLRTLIPVLPLHFTSMTEMWGAGTALDVLRMMSYEQYKMVGQFALDKWIGQIGAAQDLYEAIVGFVSEQEKRSREGLGEKPTNDADKLQQLLEILAKKHLELASRFENIDNQFLNAVRESLERFEIIFRRLRVLETDKRGERAPLWLKDVDIWERNSDGSIKLVGDQRVFNREIDNNRDTGTSRHSGELFFWRFVNWLRSSKEGEGQNLYEDVAIYYELMDQNTIASLRLARRVDGSYDETKLQTRWQWLLGKINR